MNIKTENSSPSKNLHEHPPAEQVQHEGIDEQSRFMQEWVQELESQVHRRMKEILHPEGHAAWN